MHTAVHRPNGVRQKATAAESDRVLRPRLAKTLVGVSAWLHAFAGTRPARPRIVLIAIPLAMTASVLTQPLALILLLASAWWWTPGQHGWVVILRACGRAAVA